MLHPRNGDLGAMLDLDALFRRIGYAGPLREDLPTLVGLQRAFVLTVPFENLDIRLGRPLRLEVPWLFHKVVVEHRGGFCYELNGLFAAILETIGFRVTRLGVSLRNRDTGSWTSPYAHLGLRVDLEESWLVDVGLNDAIRAPLGLWPDVTQTDGWTHYRLAQEAAGTWLLAFREPGEPWEARYRFDAVPRALEDFAPACEARQTAPDSLFRTGYLCCRALAEGRVTVTGQRVVVSDRAGRRERTLLDQAAFESALLEHLGLDLPAIVAALGDPAGP